VVRWPNYSGEQWRADLGKPVEGVGELIRPGPTMVDSDSGSALPAYEAGGDVQQPVAQHLGLGLGQVVGQEGGLGPSDQVGRGQRELQPGLVDRQVAGGEATDPGLLKVSNLVLYPGVGPVPGFQPGELTDGRVGRYGLIAPAVMGFQQRDLGAPGCGRSRRTKTRIPVGQPLPTESPSMPVSSAI
jgi:hypothetical protein